MKPYLTIALLAIGLSVSGQETTTLNPSAFTSSGQGYLIKSEPIIDTIPTLLVYIDKRKEQGQVMHVNGFQVRRQDGYYDSPIGYGNMRVSMYNPKPLMIHVKYLDADKKELPDYYLVIISTNKL